MGSSRRFISRVTHAFATRKLHSFVVACGVLPTACTDSGPNVAESLQASTVSDFTSSGCSTAVVKGLARQIAREADCEHPGNFVHMPSGNGIRYASNAVLPFLALHARDDLQTVAQSHPVLLASALRTLPQQYLLFNWWHQHRCGIAKAATPGTSNHEGGRAVDLVDWSTRIGNMANHGWSHDVAGDPVHFDHLSTPDRRGEDVHAFQVLWNRNHPNDQIATDGQYGPQTEDRLRRSPATGFAKGASCIARETDPVVAVDGEDLVPPATQQQYLVTLENDGDTDWPAGAAIELASATSSQLFDASWTSSTVITTLGTPIPAGGQGTVMLPVTTPVVTDATPIDETLQIRDGATIVAMFDFALTVQPGMTTATSSDGGDEEDQPDDGGCNAAGGSAGLAPLVLALGMLARRRARR